MGKIALKLKPEIEARAKANQGTRTDLSVKSPKGYAPTDTRKEMAQAVGICLRTLPPSLKEALESKKVSVNRGWKILKAVQQLPMEEQESAASEMLSAVRESYELAQTFQAIGDLLKNEVLHDCRRAVHSDED